MEERGELFLQKISMSRAKVAKLCHTFIKDGAVSTATHSLSYGSMLLIGFFIFANSNAFHSVLTMPL